MFPERLRYLRKKRGISMKEFGSRFGLAESTISGYENGLRTPDLETLSKFADFFEVTIDFLVGRTDSPNPPTFTDTELEFLNDVNLPLEQLKEKYNLTVDGKPASESELLGMIAWIRANRSLLEEKK